MRLHKQSHIRRKKPDCNGLLCDVLQHIYEGQRLETETISRVSTVSPLGFLFQERCKREFSIALIKLNLPFRQFSTNKIALLLFLNFPLFNTLTNMFVSGQRTLTPDIQQIVVLIFFLFYFEG